MTYSVFWTSVPEEEVIVVPVVVEAGSVRMESVDVVRGEYRWIVGVSQREDVVCDGPIGGRRGLWIGGAGAGGLDGRGWKSLGVGGGGGQSLSREGL
jgi:hypothetical protein